MFIGFLADNTTGYYRSIASMVLPIVVIGIYVLTALLARPFVDKIRGLVQTFIYALFDVLIFGLCIVYLSFEPYDGWAVGIVALIGGPIFFSIVMYVMNHHRVGSYQPPKVEGDDNYIRM